MVLESVRPATSAARRVVLADGTYATIKKLILDHEIPPGEHIGIDELARNLSVSQTPVREALARLEADGLVGKVPLRGYETTALLTVEQFDALFQFRGIIEPWAASEASRRANRRDIEAIEAELDRAEGIPRTGGESTYPEFADHDTRFHSLIARAADNPFVEEAFTRSHCHMHLVRVYRATIDTAGSQTPQSTFVQNLFAEYYQGGKPPLAVSEHTAIAQAIVAGDGPGASQLMRHHIDSSRLRFIPAVEALNATA